jgi:hypothetical protein
VSEREHRTSGTANIRTARAAPAIQQLPADLRLIAYAVFDLAYYRDVPISDDLAASVAFELQDRVKKLPEVQRALGR